jgi:hypothetical protein
MDESFKKPGTGDSPEGMPRLYRQAMGVLFCIKYSSYLVPCRSDSDELNSSTKFAAFVTPTGERFIPAFTEPDELDKWPYTHDKAMLLTFDDLKYTVLNETYKLSGIVIDPFSKRFFLTQKQIEIIDQIAEGVVIHNVKHSGFVKLSKPEREMPQMFKALNVFFSSREYVYKAYILMLKEPADQEAHFLVVVDFDGDTCDLFPVLAKVISANLNQGETFEMMKATYSILKTVMPVSDPIYKKHKT